MAHDPLNRVTTMVDAVGTTTYAYTAGGQLWTEDGPFSNDTVTNSYTYRLRTGLALQQPTGVWTNGFWYDYAKRLTNVTSPAGTFSYTLVGQASRLSKLSLPNTSYITNHYDNVARLLFTKLNNSSHTTLNKHEYVYNTGHQRTKHTRPDNSHLTFSYDPIGQLTIVRATNSGGTLLTGETKGYAYDAAWNLNRRTNNSSGSTHTFTVDTKNQLTNATPVGKQTYDDNGNLLYAAGSYHGYAYDDENRLVRWYYYGAGYDGEGQPTSSEDWRTDLVYDGLGRLRKRVEYEVGGLEWWVWSETYYIYDGMRVIQERGDATVSYTRGSDLSGTLEGAGGIGGLLARSPGSTHSYYHADGGGNVTYLVNSSQGLAASYRYDAYGNLVSYSGTLALANVYRFSSKEQHAYSGLYYYGYRWYHPNLQRWLNRDPLGEPGFECVRLVPQPLFVRRLRLSIDDIETQFRLLNAVRNGSINMAIYLRNAGVPQPQGAVSVSDLLNILRHRQNSYTPNWPAELLENPNLFVMIGNDPPNTFDPWGNGKWYKPWTWEWPGHLWEGFKVAIEYIASGSEFTGPLKAGPDIYCIATNQVNKVKYDPFDPNAEPPGSGR